MKRGSHPRWQEQWLNEHNACRERYARILSIEHPDSLIMFARYSKKDRRFEEKCKQHNKPMWVYASSKKSWGIDEHDEHAEETEAKERSAYEN